MHTGTSRAVGPTSGRLRWTRDLGANVTPGPVVAADGTIYSATNAGVLHALDPATGADRWTFDGAGVYGLDLSTSPTVLEDGTILWPGSRSRLFALNPDGTLRWSKAFAAQLLSPAITPDGIAYFGDHRGYLNGVRVADGHLVRRVRGLGFRRGHSSSIGVWTSPAIDRAGNVYFGTRPGHNYGFASDGRRWFDINAHATVDSYPAITGGGMLVIGATNGILYGIAD